jgi:hypothetical protein
MVSCSYIFDILYNQAYMYLGLCQTPLQQTAQDQPYLIIYYLVNFSSKNIIFDPKRLFVRTFTAVFHCILVYHKFAISSVEPPTSEESAHSSGGPDANGLVEARIFRCGLCGKAFNRNDHLNRHVKFVHTQVSCRHWESSIIDVIYELFVF